MALIGHQAPGFTDFHPNPFLMSQTFGIVFQHVGLTEYIATALDAVTQEEVEADMDRVAGTFPFKALDTGFGCEKHEIAASSRHYLAMKKLVKDNNLDALAIRCWPEVLTQKNNKTQYFRLRWYDSDFECSLSVL